MIMKNAHQERILETFIITVSLGAILFTAIMAILLVVR